MSKTKRKIALLGSTGSIGVQTIEVVENYPEVFEIEVLTANNNADLLIKQARKINPNVVVIANEEKYDQVNDALSSLDIKVYGGSEALAQVVQMDQIDIVLTALVGYSGLIPTIKAIEARKIIALANKETLVVAGSLVTSLAKQYGVPILPVDSEHSAIFQCLVGEQNNPIDKLILTCSGGPFRGYSKEQLLNVTRHDALQHPNWDMGAKITIDSATLMNKGFEAIEAKWLFDVAVEDIDVVVHPQSIVHSMVQFEDGSVKAQLGLPDMKLPIQYALGFPQRLKSNFPKMSIKDYSSLIFEEPNTKLFRNLQLAFDAIVKGGNIACALNAANEITVDAFLNDKLSFLDISRVNERVMNTIDFVSNPLLQDYIDTDEKARVLAQEFIKK